ncbi:beta-1,4-glucuronyltransferase 1 [Neodiprion lecontei]|uniref:Beta-1,4-glucuronyltransferase 1 n=1 Tax=Neodiprion lecontei TaxID=441921 RepID=A0A6J0BJV2_NEOLC|nr:beta-1,4-glucuronyltransferase 1 [Neodiprion lecontei]
MVSGLRRGRRIAVFVAGLVAAVIFAHLLASRGSSVLVWSEKTARAKQPVAITEQIQEFGLVYAAGVYMAGRRPRNLTFCEWAHGLPRSLSYTSADIAWSPEAGEKGPYRVLSGVLGGYAGAEAPPVTLCTHATAEQVYAVVELARRWEGPISLAIFAPGLDAGLAVALLERACGCEPGMARVAVQLIFPAGRPPALRPRSQALGDCAASDIQLRESETERKSRNMMYPVNVARNVARSNARTPRVLVSDIELLPSENLASGFVEMVRGRPPRVGVVFVVPAFEVEANEKPPNTKHELLMAARAGVGGYFHRFVCAHCQKFPGLTRWMLRPDPGRVRPSVVTRREFPHHRWEPVYIGTREDPLYTEDMSWEGRQDKMAQMLEMCLLSYRLVVLDGAFLVHAPGVKRRPTSIDNRREAWRRPYERRNSRIYQSVVRRLQKQYPANPRCRQ